jgi:RNA polymerase sigma-70 factor (ECF subfamily)
MRAAPFLDEIARRGARAPDDLDARLRAVEQTARGAWPGLDAGDAFAEYLAARWPDGATLDEWLAGAHASDLWLTCACARGVPGAIEAFDRAHLGAVADYLARSRADAALVEDVRQSLREKLFVGGGRKIEEYSGRGPLGGWIRVLAVRAAIDLRRRRGERAPDLRGEQPQAIDPELGYLADRYRGHVEEAFRRSLGALDGEQRTLLRMHFVDGVTLDELARLKNLHRATIARRLQHARRVIFEETSRHLRERLSLSTEELTSLVGLVRSQLQISVARLLAS